MSGERDGPPATLIAVTLACRGPGTDPLTLEPCQLCVWRGHAQSPGAELNE
jgi:hypothetical protein